MTRSLLLAFSLSFLAGCASTCENNPYTARKTLADDGQDRHYYTAPLGLIPEDQKIPSLDVVRFQRLDDRVHVLSYVSPNPHRIFIYAEGADGQLRPLDRDPRACLTEVDHRPYLTTQNSDRRVVVFTIINDEECEDRAVVFCDERLSRDVFELQ